MKGVTLLPKLNGKRVLIRVDYNVPLKPARPSGAGGGKKILDVRRIESSYKTIDAVLKKGGTPILIAHLAEGKPTLRPIAEFLSKKYKQFLFITSPIESKKTQQSLESVKKGTVILFENIRRNAGEERNTVSFSKLLASFGDFYVNDAFSVSHRPHASIVGVPALMPSYAGFQLQAEVKALDSVLKAKAHPFLFILGGAKFETKIPLLKRFSEIADGMVIAGAILNDFYKAAGFEIGTSVADGGFDAEIQKILKNHKLLLPTDVVVVRGKKHIVIASNEVEKKDKIVDIGPASIEHIIKKIKKAKLVAWNGPTGWYEGGFTKGTIALAKALSASNAKTVIGGGDTGAVLEKMLGKSAQNKNIFISTGGGATLEYLSKGTLPGIKALR